MLRKRVKRLRSSKSKKSPLPIRPRIQLERLESRELLSFGSLVQIGGLSPYTNTSDITAQSGSHNYLNSEVEPRIAVDPNNPLHMVGVYQQDRWNDGGSRGCMAAASFDGGNTWTATPLPGCTVNNGGFWYRNSDPWVSIGPDGTVYAITIPLQDPSGVHSDGVYVNTSADGGMTWSAPATLIIDSGSPFNDKESITADPKIAGSAYAVWDRLNTGNGGPTMFSRTTDGGKTWSTPNAILDPVGQTISNQLVVLPNGTLVNMCEDLINGSPDEIAVVRSTDHGSTWSAPIVVFQQNAIGVTDPNNGAGVRSGDLIPDIGVDRTSGNMYVVCQDGRFSGNTHADIALSESTDGGLTWSTPIKVNQTPTNVPTADQQAWIGSVAVAADGEVAVTYYDFRNNTVGTGLPTFTDYWIAFANPSLPGPLTFGNEQRLTTSSFNLQLAPNASGEFLGDYQGVIAGGQTRDTFGAIFVQTVSSTEPSVTFFRGAVAPNPLSLTQFHPPAAIVGQAAGGALATFTDASPDHTLSEYTATLTWGDGHTDTLTSATGNIVQNLDGSFSVFDTHTYSSAGSGLTFSVTISTPGGFTAGNSASVTVLPGFGSLAQVGPATSPYPNTSDITAQPGSHNYLNSEVEPRIAVDPNNPRHLVAVFQQDRWNDGGNRGDMGAVSTDGGNTWTSVFFPGTTVNNSGHFLRDSDPWVSIGPDGMVYVLNLMINDPTDGYADGVMVSTSTDGGFHYSAAVGITLNTNSALTNDKDAITADPTTPGYAYAVWDQLGSGNGGPTMFSRTTDGGKTWSTPQIILNPAGQTLSNQIAVLPNGTLVNMCEDLINGSPDEIAVVRSTDHGSTWSAPIVVFQQNAIGVSDPNNGAGVRSGDLIPDIAVDRTSGNMYVVCQDGRFSGNTHADIALSESTDGGLTWSTPVKVNQTPSNIPNADRPAFTASVAVAANGEVAVAYYDFRNNTIGTGLPTLTDYWIAFANPSLPGPLTFGNEQRLTTSSFNLQLAPNANGEFLGDYMGLVAGGQTSNSFGAIFVQTVSSSEPTSTFFRGAIAPNPLSMSQFSPPAPTEGQSTGGQLATFTDKSPHHSIADYTAVVSWGDGHTDYLTSANGGIQVTAATPYAVIDSHTYAEESAGLPFSITILTPDGFTGGFTSGSSATVPVADAALTPGALTPPTATEGSAFSNVTVFHFTDANTTAPATDYSAVVTLGDGNTVTLTTMASANGQVVATGSGGYDVRLSYTYVEGFSNHTFGVQVSDVGGSSTGGSTSSFTVTDYALAAGALTVPFAIEGAPLFNVPVFHFSDADPTAAISEYTAVVTLGDGNTVTLTSTASPNGQIVASGGGFDVQLSYTYAEEFTNHTFAVQVTDTGGATTGASSSTFQVHDGPLSDSALTPPIAAEGQQLTNVAVFQFHDNAAGTAADFTAVVTLGDGNSFALTGTPSTNGQVVSTGGGTFAVQLSYKYAEGFTNHTFGVQVNDDGGSSIGASTGNFSVADYALTAGALTPPSATEGAQFSGVTVFHFSDADPTATDTSEYTAVVTLGDGNSVTLTGTPGANGLVVANGGGFDVRLAYTYAEELSGKTFAVQVTDAGGATTGSSASGFGVADAALTPGALTPPAATEGTAFSNVTVFHFTDAYATAPLSDYNAVVTLGDGNTVSLTTTASANGQIVSTGSGGFDVRLSYTYAEGFANHTFGVQVSDAGGSSTGASTGNFSVADYALTAGALMPPTATEGQVLSGVTVFHFTDADPTAAAGEYTAVVTLGDGNTVTLTGTAGANGQVVASGGGFDVRLNYTYAEELSGKTFAVQVTDAGGATTGSSASGFGVADAALTPGALTPPSATEGSAFSNVTVFHFSDAYTTAPASDYSAVVTLGDGTTVTLTTTANANGQVVSTGSGGYDVRLSYTYAEGFANHNFGVQVSDVGGSSTGATTGNFSVADYGLTAGALTPPVATEGKAFSGVTVFHFSDADPTASASEYSATVTLGDGNSVTLTSTPSANGQIVANAGGFDVQVAYTYAEELSGKTFGVQVTDAGGATTGSSASGFGVADAALTPGALTPPSATEGSAFSNVTVFHFSDAYTTAPASDYSAVVTLGDGTTVTLTTTANANGQVVSTGGGGYDVRLSYTYAEGFANHTFGVQVSDVGGSSTGASTGNFSVADYGLTAGALTPPVATAGQPFSNVTVFHFSDADPTAGAAEYSAVVTLGDGNSVTLTGTAGANGQIVANGGGFDVQLSYTYSSAFSNHTFAVQVTDTGGASTGASTNNFSVGGGGGDVLTAGPLTPPSVVEVQTFSGVTVFHFTDSNTGAPASNFTAVVTLGDGNTVTLSGTAGTNGQIVSTGSGGFDVQLSYTYAEELSGKTFGVQVSATGGATTGASTSTFSVADAALTPGALTPPSATEGTALSNVMVFHFTDAYATAPASDYNAVVTLGDGNTVALTTTASDNGQIVSTGSGGYDVRLSYTYGEGFANHTFGVQVSDAGGSSTGASTGNFSVADFALTAGALTLPSATEGAPFSGVVFRFSDADPTAGASEYTALVTLGDGNTVTLTGTSGPNGQVVANGGGFDVQLSYTYAEELTGKTFGVQVSDSVGTSTGASTSSFGVGDASLTAGALTAPVATEGSAFSNVTVFHFSDAYTTAPLSDYSAVVTLGDGNTVTLTTTPSANGQIVSTGGGGFDVRLSDTYAEELANKTFGVQVSDTGGASTGASTGGFGVADAILTSAAKTFQVTENAAVTNVTVATFTDADPGGQLGDYSASVTWGDGDTSASVTIMADPIVPGQFDVVASKSHGYAEGGTYLVTVAIADAGGATSMANSTAAVADLPLTATAVNVKTTEGEGTGVMLVVAKFSDAETGQPVTHYTAVIDWGDGSTSSGAVVGIHSAGNYQVQGSHTYNEAGTYTVTVTITDVGGAKAVANSTASVADAALSGSLTGIRPVHNTPFSGTVATFTDGNSFATMADFTATINWGDGTTTTATVVQNADGSFSLQGSHTYLSTGMFTMTVTVSDDDGALLTLKGKIRVT
jgi:hypothetical protein